MKPAPVPPHIQDLIDQRQTLAAEASRLEAQARDKRAECRQLSTRIDMELTQHTSEVFRQYKEREAQREAAKWSAKPPKSLAERTPSARAEREAQLLRAVQEGRWEDVAALSGGSR